MFKKLLFYVVCYFICIILCNKAMAMSNDLPNIELDMAYARTCPTTFWAKKVNDITKGQNRPYLLTLNLDGFYSDKVYNIKYFLESLSRQKPLYCQELFIKNGTSHKFNVLCEGIKALFQRPEIRKIIYQHAGIATPLAATKGLASIRETSRGKLLRRGDTILELEKIESMSSVEDLSQALSKVSLGDNPEGGISEVSFLGEVVSRDELESEKEEIAKAWKSINVGEDPFPEIDRKEKILKIHADELRHLLERESSCSKGYVFFEASGVMNTNVDDIVSVCMKNRSICFLSIIDSGISIEKMAEFLKILNDGSVKLIDIRTASTYDDPYQCFLALQKTFKHIHEEEMLSRFIIWRSEEQLEGLKREEISLDIRLSPDKFFKIEKRC